jgi:hypothetical protein
MKTTKKFGDAEKTGKAPGKWTARLAVRGEAWEEAERLAEARAACSLEQLLSDLVADLATAQARPDSWEAQKIWAWLDARYRPAHLLRLEREKGF